MDPNGPLSHADRVFVSVTDGGDESTPVLAYGILTDARDAVLDPPVLYGDYGIAGASRFAFFADPAHPLCGEGRRVRVQVHDFDTGMGAELVYEPATAVECECEELVCLFDETCWGEGGESTYCQMLAADICPDGVLGCDVGSFTLLGHDNAGDTSDFCVDPFAPWISVSGTRARMEIRGGKANCRG